MILVALQIIACIGVIFGGPFFLWAQPLPLLTQGIGIAIGLWAVMTMRRFNIAPTLRKEATLVTNGPFRWVRNPMYLGLLLIFAPPVLHPPYLPIQTGSFILLVIVLVLKVRMEERELRKAFSEYEAYTGQTKRLIPFLF